MKWKDSFHPYAIITIIFWSLATALTRLVLHYFSASSLGFLRYFIASCALAVVVFATKMQAPKKEDLKWFLASGALGFFLYMIAFNSGAQTVAAATCSVILATVPVFTAILARFFFQEKLSGLQWGAIALEFAGVVLLSLLNGALSINRGLLWLFLAVIALSSYNLLQRRLTKTYSGLQASTYSIFAGALMLAVFAPTALREVRVAPPVQLFYIAILGIFCSALAYVTWTLALKKAKLASSVSNYMFVTPFLTSLFGFLLADETPDLATLAGGAVILLGMVIFNFEAKVRAFLARPKEDA